MKKAFSILLILLLLLNVIGYYGIFFGLKVLNDNRVNSNLDRDVYAGSEAITIRISFSLPYSSNQDSYERADGTFEYDGRMYRIVKQKLYNDTLYVVCVNDQKGKAIRDAFEELEDLMTAIPADTNSSGNQPILLIKDFEKCEKLTVNITPSAIKVRRPACTDSAYSSNFVYSIDHPPQG